MRPVSPISPHRARLGGLLRVAGSALILFLLFRFIPFADAWRALRRLPLAVWLVVLAAYFSVHLIGICKYRLVLNTAGAGLNIAQAARCYFVGLFGSLFLPSVIGGDLIKAGLALRLTKSRAGVLLGTLLDRMSDVVALLTLATIGLVLAQGRRDIANRHAILLGTTIFAAVCAVIAAVVTQLPARRFSWRMRRRMVRLRRAGRSTAHQPGRVAAAYAMSLTVQFGFILLTSAIAGACDLHLPFAAWLYAWPLAKLSAMLPLSQAGIGVREAALAALLVPFGAAAAVIVGVGLAWETVVIAAGLISGGFSLAIGRLPAGQRLP